MPMSPSSPKLTVFLDITGALCCQTPTGTAIRLHEAELYSVLERMLLAQAAPGADTRLGTDASPTQYALDRVKRYSRSGALQRDLDRELAELGLL